MNTINAQTIINEAMAAHAIAPDNDNAHCEAAFDFRAITKQGYDFFCDMGIAPGCGAMVDYLADRENDIVYAEFYDALALPALTIKFKTAAKGFQTVKNIKANLMRFADLVRKNAAAFGGGLVRTAKPRPSVSWPANLVALFKQSIEDHDYRAALDIGDRLGALFYTSSKGNVFMQVAPVPCDFNDRVVSVCNEDGKFSVIDPVSMRALTGLTLVQKRTRAAQVENVRLKLESMPSFDLDAAIDKQSSFAVDQSILRAHWILEHGLDSEAIETRIDAHNAQIEEQASQDVAQVVAQALATIAITEAMADTSEDARELATCEAGESEASAPTAGRTSWSPVPQYVPPSLSQVKPGEPVPPAYRGTDDASPTPPAEFTQDTPVMISSAIHRQVALKYAQCIRRSGPMHHFPHHCHERTSGMSNSNSTVSIERINQLLSYNPDTRVITWKEGIGMRWAGCVAGEVNEAGYRLVTINGKRLRAHRIAWAIVNGKWPTLHLDHINGIRDDNRISNLRLVTSGQNSQNIRSPLSSNKHGFLGVKNNKGRWVATISVNRKFMYLGSFATPEIAHEEYLKAKRQVHKFCTI